MNTKKGVITAGITTMVILAAFTAAIILSGKNNEGENVELTQTAGASDTPTEVTENTVPSTKGDGEGTALTADTTEPTAAINTEAETEGTAETEAETTTTTTTQQIPETEPEITTEENSGGQNDDYSSTTSKGYKIERINGITYVDGIMIANKTYTLPKTYDPGIQPDAYNAFLEMQSAAAKEGVSLYIVSGYRSYYDQEIVYAGWVNRDGVELADTYSSRPGHSDHQTGFTFDLNSLYQSFADTKEGIWLAEHCADYGFIIRYPNGKEAYTGYMYEPWHVRFIGVEKAKAITASGLSLEEYYGITSDYADCED